MRKLSDRECEALPNKGWKNVPTGTYYFGIDYNDAWQLDSKSMFEFYRDMNKPVIKYNGGYYTAT